MFPCRVRAGTRQGSSVCLERRMRSSRSCQPRRASSVSRQTRRCLMPVSPLHAHVPTCPPPAKLEERRKLQSVAATSLQPLDGSVVETGRLRSSDEPIGSPGGRGFAGCRSFNSEDEPDPSLMPLPVLDMGISKEQAEMALCETGNSGVEVAAEWIFTHLQVRGGGGCRWRENRTQAGREDWWRGAEGESRRKLRVSVGEGQVGPLPIFTRPCCRLTRRRQRLPWGGAPAAVQGVLPPSPPPTAPGRRLRWAVKSASQKGMTRGGFGSG